MYKIAHLMSYPHANHRPATYASFARKRSPIDTIDYIVTNCDGGAISANVRRRAAEFGTSLASHALSLNLAHRKVGSARANQMFDHASGRPRASVAANHQWRLPWN
jgi:hypothetical protein